MSYDFDEFIAKIPTDYYLKNCTFTELINQVKINTPKYLLDDIVFLSKKDNLWASPLGYLLREHDKIAFLGCCYCLSQNHKYDKQNGTLWIAGQKAIPFSQKCTDLDDIRPEADKYLFFCPHCNNLIDRWAKNNEFVINNDRIDQSEINEINKYLRSV